MKRFVSLLFLLSSFSAFSNQDDLRAKCHVHEIEYSQESRYIVYQKGVDGGYCHEEGDISEAELQTVIDYCLCDRNKIEYSFSCNILGCDM